MEENPIVLDFQAEDFFHQHQAEAVMSALSSSDAVRWIKKCVIRQVLLEQQSSTEEVDALFALLTRYGPRRVLDDFQQRQDSVLTEQDVEHIVYRILAKTRPDPPVTPSAVLAPQVHLAADARKKASPKLKNL